MNLDELIKARNEIVEEYVKLREAGERAETYEEAQEILKEFCTDKFMELETEEDMDALNYAELLITAIQKFAYDIDHTEENKAMEEIIKKYREV